MYIKLYPSEYLSFFLRPSFSFPHRFSKLVSFILAMFYNKTIIITTGVINVNTKAAYPNPDEKYSPVLV